MGNMVEKAMKACWEPIENPEAFAKRSAKHKDLMQQGTFAQTQMAKHHSADAKKAFKEAAKCAGLEQFTTANPKEALENCSKQLTEAMVNGTLDSELIYKTIFNGVLSVMTDRAIDKVACKMPNGAKFSKPLMAFTNAMALPDIYKRLNEQKIDKKDAALRWSLVFCP